MADKYMKTLQLTADGDTYHPLPIVTTSDNDKILQVVDGEWAMASVTNAEEVEY